MVMTYLQSCA